MISQEYECKRCLSRFDIKEECMEADPHCPSCGGVAVEPTEGQTDDLDVLRTKGAGGGC